MSHLETISTYVKPMSISDAAIEKLKIENTRRPSLKKWPSEFIFSPKNLIYTCEWKRNS